MRSFFTLLFLLCSFEASCASEECFKIANPSRYRDCLNANNNSFVAPVQQNKTSNAKDVILQNYQNTVKNYAVNPLKPDSDPDDFGNIHPSPHLAIAAVTPPSRYCMEKICWPAVFYFAHNPSSNIAQKIFVQCYAFDSNNDVVGSAKSWVGLDPGKSGESIILFEGSEYNKFRSVDCFVLGSEPL